MTPEIWSIAVGIDGISLCAMAAGGDAQRRQFYAPFQTKRWRGMTIIDPGEVARLFGDGLSALFEGGESEAIAIALVTPHRQTCVLTDGEGELHSPILLDIPLPIARRDVPAVYLEDELLAAAYRSSLVRRLRNLSPDDCLKPAPGIGTLGSYIAHMLTGHACDASEPLGVPESYWTNPECRQGAFVEAMGIDWSASYQSVRSLCPFARVSPFAAMRIYRQGAIPSESEQASSFCIDGRIEKLAGLPVYALGSIDAARAFASCADPIRWSVKIGYDMRAHWNARRFACAAYEITIDEEADENAAAAVADAKPTTMQRDNLDTDDTNPEYSTAPCSGESHSEHSKKPLSYEDWTRAWNDCFTLELSPSLKPTDTAYGVSIGHMESILPQTARIKASQSDAGVYPFEALRRASVGSSGLHIVPTKNGCTVVGLRAGHADEHWMRAWLESILYDLRAKRAQIPDLSGAPISLILAPPWDAACAQWAADILAAPVRYIPASEPEIAAVGAAISLMRHVDLPTPQTSVAAQIFEPSDRAKSYESHFAIHCALIDALS